MLSIPQFKQWICSCFRAVRYRENQRRQILWYRDGGDRKGGLCGKTTTSVSNSLSLCGHLWAHPPTWDCSVSRLSLRLSSIFLGPLSYCFYKWFMPLVVCFTHDPREILVGKALPCAYSHPGDKEAVCHGGDQVVVTSKSTLICVTLDDLFISSQAEFHIGNNTSSIYYLGLLWRSTQITLVEQ